MPKKTILVGEDSGAHIGFLSDYFSDTKSIPIFAKTKEDVMDAFGMLNPDFVFMKIEWMDPKFVEQFQAYRKQKPAAKFFSIGYANDESFKWDNQFEAPLELKTFRKKLLAEVNLPATINLLIVEDEKGILELFKDYFENQNNPHFKVECAENGLTGFQKLEKDPPHCIILDIKMPIRSGIEFYGDLKKSNREIPVIVFLDSTSPDEITQLRKYGTPVLIEKSGHQSSMPEMLGMIKKLVYFA